MNKFGFKGNYWYVSQVCWFIWISDSRFKVVMYCWKELIEILNVQKLTFFDVIDQNK